MRPCFPRSRSATENMSYECRRRSEMTDCCLRFSPPEHRSAKPQAAFKLPLRKLEALSRSLFAVLLAFLHAAVAGEVAGVAEFLVHADGGGVGSGIGGNGAEHDFEGAGQTLGDGAGLSREAAAVHLHGHVEPVLHFRQLQRTEHGVAVLVFGEVTLERPAVDRDRPRSFTQADAGDGGLAPPGAEVELFLGFGCGFGHGELPQIRSPFSILRCAMPTALRGHAHAKPWAWHPFAQR